MIHIPVKSCPRGGGGGRKRARTNDAVVKGQKAGSSECLGEEARVVTGRLPI